MLGDDSGKTYADLGGGSAVLSFGVADEEWVSAISKQAATLQHISNLYYTEPCVTLAEQLCERTGMKKVFYGNSGAEANECAIKVARKYSEDKYGAGRNIIVTLKNSFHGRTLGTLAATGQDDSHKMFQPLPAVFCSAEANDCAGLCALVESNPCMSERMSETIQS